jgi:biotin transporter BioY
MSEIQTRIILPATGFFVVYLLGAFVETSFNISSWANITRFMVALIGGVSILALATFPYEFKKKK